MLASSQENAAELLSSAQNSKQCWRKKYMLKALFFDWAGGWDCRSKLRRSKSESNQFTGVRQVQVPGRPARALCHVDLFFYWAISLRREQSSSIIKLNTRMASRRLEFAGAIQRSSYADTSSQRRWKKKNNRWFLSFTVCVCGRLAPVNWITSPFYSLNKFPSFIHISLLHNHTVQSK